MGNKKNKLHKLTKCAKRNLYREVAEKIKTLQEPGNPNLESHDNIERCDQSYKSSSKENVDPNKSFLIDMRTNSQSPLHEPGNPNLESHDDIERCDQSRESSSKENLDPNKSFLIELHTRTNSQSPSKNIKMAKMSFLLVLIQVISLPILGGLGQGSPVEEILASVVSQYADGESGGGGNAAAGMIGQVLGTLMQGDNMKNLGALLGQSGNARGENSAGDILSGLGSLLGGQNGQIDPSLLGNVVSMFAQQMAQPQEPKREKRSQDNDLNLESIMSLASTFLGGQNQNGGASILPVIMNALSSLSTPDAQKRAEDHKDHAEFLPPFLEKVHLYWDLFINSELGKTIWEKSGLKRALKAFTGPDGKISFELMFKNFENQSFRRHWIKAAAKYLTDVVVHAAKPEVYQRYLVSAQYIINSFIDTQGLPKSAQFNVNKPEKSISALVNFALKKYLDMDTDVSGYVKPAVDYLKQTFKMAEAASQKLASRGDYNAIADRVTDTLNLEVIEPVLRVYRAYQHSVKAPHCAEHLMCLVNKHPDANKQGLPGFKSGLTKFSSLAASAALSYQKGKGFWDLYNAIQSDVNCEAAYPADCAAFHEHELKVTTEVYHSEL